MMHQSTREEDILEPGASLIIGEQFSVCERASGVPFRRALPCRSTISCGLLLNSCYFGFSQKLTAVQERY
jgi:hypothetical protein